LAVPEHEIRRSGKTGDPCFIRLPVEGEPVRLGRREVEGLVSCYAAL
jgi:hypothetical protein